MSFLRSTARIVPRTAFRSTVSTRAAFTTTPRTLATSDYGSGSGDPKGENPQSQGANPSADKEHPGPPPPAAGKGSGSGPTKGGDKDAHQGKSPNSSEGKKGTSGGDQASSGNGAQPKILAESPPKESEQSQEVKEHNQEVHMIGFLSPFAREICALLLEGMDERHWDNLLTYPRFAA